MKKEIICDFDVCEDELILRFWEAEKRFRLYAQSSRVLYSQGQAIQEI